ILFQDFDLSPYMKGSRYLGELIDLFYWLTFISQSQFSTIKPPTLIVFPYNFIFRNLPPVEFFHDNSFFLKLDDIIAPSELSAKLTHLGYHCVDFIEEPGQYSTRGEIFDIYIYSQLAIRISYFDDLIEKISSLDL